METLPFEMVERIVRQLTPHDLARCSAVCREWREIFNQDCMWKLHCDPELEEPLRTIPCVATPAFVAPEAENPTLSPISPWKLAFMRENHLWKNWKSKEIMDKNENVTQVIDCKGIINVDFLTDTLLVILYFNHIEIMDVSVVPTALVAKTDLTYYALYSELRMIGPAMFLLGNNCSVQVYNVDIINKTIKLKHTIPTTRSRLYAKVFSKEHIYFNWDDEGSNLKIFDLNTGKLLKEEPCPVKITQNGKVSFGDMKISPTSDLVALLVVVEDSSNGKEYYKYYIYSLNQLAFLPGPVAEDEDCNLKIALQGHWLATTDYKTIEVHNMQTRDDLLSHECSKHVIRCSSRKIEAFNDCFVFADVGVDASEQALQKLYIYYPSNRSLTTLCEMSNVEKFRIINNKFIELIHDQSSVRVWKLSGQTVKNSDFSVRFGYKTNRSFTKVLNHNYLKGTMDIIYTW